jgi:hypothetical protein
MLFHVPILPVTLHLYQVRVLVYKLSQLGHLPSVRIGRKIGILESDLIKFVELNRYPQPKALTHARR